MCITHLHLSYREQFSNFARCTVRSKRAENSDSFPGMAAHPNPLLNCSKNNNYLHILDFLIDVKMLYY